MPEAVREAARGTWRICPCVSERVETPRSAGRQPEIPSGLEREGVLPAASQVEVRTEEGPRTHQEVTAGRRNKVRIRLGILYCQTLYKKLKTFLFYFPIMWSELNKQDSAFRQELRVVDCPDIVETPRASVALQGTLSSDIVTFIWNLLLREVERTLVAKPSIE